MTIGDRSAFIIAQIRDFGKWGSRKGVLKILEFVESELREAEREAYERGFNECREMAAGLFVGGDGTTLFTNRQIIDCIRALKPE